MPKVLWQFSYTVDGLRGLLKEGGTSRRAAAEQLVKELGGNLEAFYYASGEDDLYAIADVPDLKTAAAIRMTINASGVGRGKIVVLMTPEEVDDATQISVAYRPPGV